MLANKALSAAPSAVPVYVEDVFSTYLWEGNATARNIVNGIDLAGKGGMVWTKYRNTTNNHRLYDTARGATKEIYSSLTNAESTASQSLTAFNADGFSLGTGQPNENTATVVGWTFAQQAKFFDVVTYTGNGTAGRTVSHNLGSTPGCLIVKKTSGTDNWFVWHRSLTDATYRLLLNSTVAETQQTNAWNSTAPTSTVFTLGDNTNVNENGATYVAYLFAHDAGGFGASGSDNVISCGSFTTDGSGNATVNLGYEPQWILQKKATGFADNWSIYDTMRGITAKGSGSNAFNASLYPNSSDAEATTSSGAWSINSTGFQYTGGIASTTWVYVAIRRGPMKTPTSGTSVFAAETGNSSSPQSSLALGASHAGDLWIMAGGRSSPTTPQWLWADRLRGLSSTTGFPILDSSDQSAEVSRTTSPYLYRSASDSRIYFTPSTGNMTYKFARAPGFFDVVCWTGTGSNIDVTHSLGVTPEFIIGKARDYPTGWIVYHKDIGSTGGYPNYMVLNSTQASGSGASTIWRGVSSTTFSYGTNSTLNINGINYVAYLFASVSGVSKVGSYTGNGSSVTVTTGFQPRFIMVKRTDSTGNWIVSDSARGLVSGSDPYLLLNSTAAEDTDEDWVDVSSTGFTVNETSAANANVNTGTYIYLAIA
jgi:hypothetical protein